MLKRVTCFLLSRPDVYFVPDERKDSKNATDWVLFVDDIVVGLAPKLKSEDEEEEDEFDADADAIVDNEVDDLINSELVVVNFGADGSLSLIFWKVKKDEE